MGYYVESQNKGRQGDQEFRNKRELGEFLANFNDGFDPAKGSLTGYYGVSETSSISFTEKILSDLKITEDFLDSTGLIIPKESSIGDNDVNIVITDGHRRLIACTLLGLEPQVQILEKENAQNYGLRANLANDSAKKLSKLALFRTACKIYQGWDAAQQKAAAKNFRNLGFRGDKPQIMTGICPVQLLHNFVGDDEILLARAKAHQVPLLKGLKDRNEILSVLGANAPKTRAFSKRELESLEEYSKDTELLEIFQLLQNSNNLLAVKAKIVETYEKERVLAAAEVERIEAIRLLVIKNRIISDFFKAENSDLLDRAEMLADEKISELEEKELEDGVLLSNSKDPKIRAAEKQRFSEKREDFFRRRQAEKTGKSSEKAVKKPAAKKKAGAKKKAVVK